jgi:hypothetical protein
MLAAVAAGVHAPLAVARSVHVASGEAGADFFEDACGTSGVGKGQAPDFTFGALGTVHIGLAADIGAVEVGLCLHFHAFLPPSDIAVTVVGASHATVAIASGPTVTVQLELELCRGLLFGLVAELGDKDSNIVLVEENWFDIVDDVPVETHFPFDTIANLGESAIDQTVDGLKHATLQVFLTVDIGDPCDEFNLVTFGDGVDSGFEYFDDGSQIGFVWRVCVIGKLVSIFQITIGGGRACEKTDRKDAKKSRAIHMSTPRQAPNV